MSNANIFTNFPKRGDIWLRKIETREDCFIKLDTLDFAAIDTSAYEVLGVVADRDADNILVVYKYNSSKVFFTRSWRYLSGYTLDGIEHTGTISARFSSNSWAANIDKVITYRAEDIDTLVSVLNDAFAADTDFSADDWEASVIDGKIRLTASAAWQSFSYTTAKNGFSLTSSAPELLFSYYMLRKNGNYNGWGTVSNYDKALQYLRVDNKSHSPTTPVTSLLKVAAPVCLPAYIGESAYSDGDMCEHLRSIFGDGEEGWQKYLQSYLPVLNTQNGVFSVEDGKKITQMIARMRYNSPNTQNGTFSPMVDYVANIETTTISAGELYVPSAKQLYKIIGSVKYGTSSNADSDVLNKALYAIGGNAIKNTSNWWSCCRCISNGAWCSYGIHGLFGNNTFSYTYGVVPSLHLNVAKPLLKI